MPILRLVAAPPARAVSLVEAKAHLNVDFDDDDLLITAYIDAATERLSYLNRQLSPASLALDLECFPGEIMLPRPPLVAVTSISYVDPAGVTRTLAEAEYEVKIDALGQGRVRPKTGHDWPLLGDAREPVTIAFSAGYGVVPGPIRAAILLTIGALYEQRAEVSAGQVYALPFGVDALVSTYRIWTA